MLWSSLIQILSDIIGYVLDCKHCLLTGWADLGLRKEKAIGACIPEFKSERIFYSLIISPVIRAPGSKIWNEKTAKEKKLAASLCNHKFFTVKNIMDRLTIQRKMKYFKKSIKFCPRIILWEWSQKGLFREMKVSVHSYVVGERIRKSSLKNGCLQGKHKHLQVERGQHPKFLET